MRPATSVVKSTHTFLTDKFNPSHDFRAEKMLSGKLGMETNDPVDALQVNDSDTEDAISNTIHKNKMQNCFKSDQQLSKLLSVPTNEISPKENLVLPEMSSDNVNRIEEIQIDDETMKSSSIFDDVKTKRTVLSIPITTTKKPSMKKPSVKPIDKPLPPRTKAYDPVKARQFMQEQKKKRSKQSKCNGTTAVGSRLQKEEIKKRLAALNKNSLKIVASNLKHMKANSERQNQMSITSSETNVGKRLSNHNLGTALKSTTNLSLKRKSTPTSK